MKLFSQYRGLRREMYVLFFCTLVDHAGSLIGPMLTLILSEKMGMSAGEIAAYFLIYTVLSLPIQLLGGRLTDKLNKKLLINLCDITSSALYIFCGVWCAISGLNHISLAIYLFGSLLQEVESPAYKTLVADFTTAADRDRAYSLNYLGLNLGMVLAPVIGGLLIKEHVDLIFILSGGFQLLSIVLFDIFVKKTDVIRNTGNRYEETVAGDKLWTVLKRGKVLIPYLGIFSFSMFFYSMYDFLVPLSLKAQDADTAAVYFSTMYSLNCIVVLVFTTLLTALFAKRFSIDRIVIASGLEVVGLALFFFGLGIPPLYYLAITLFTFGEIVATTTTTSHLTKRIPLDYRGRVIAVSSVLCSIVKSLGKSAVGVLYDTCGQAAAWYTVLAVGVLVTVGFFLLRRPDRKTFPELYRD